MKNKRLITLVGSVCLILVLVALPFMGACAPEEEPPPPPPPEDGEEPPPPAKPTGELRIGVATLYTETFHPFSSRTGGAGRNFRECIYDLLVNMDADGNLEPGIATKWEVSADNLAWTFDIRDGVKFHDGTPLTLEDVKFSVDELLADYSGSPRRIFGERLDRVEIIPPNKVVVYLQKPWPTLPWYFSTASVGGGFILPKKYFEEVGIEYFEHHPMGSGPYKLLEQKEGDYIKLEAAFDYHWRVGKPGYKYITFKILPEEGTRVSALKAGEVDIIEVSRSRIEDLKAAGMNIVSIKDGAEVMLHMINCNRPENPLYKLAVRQALVYAIDKKAIVENILRGEGQVIVHCESMFGWSISWKQYPLTPYDPEKARQLLAEAGYPNGFTLHMYSFITVVPEMLLINEAIASYWEDIGLDVRIIETTYTAALPYYIKEKQPPGTAVCARATSNRQIEVWRPLFGDCETYRYSFTCHDAELQRLLGEFEKQVTIEGYIEAERRCEERVLEMFWKNGICSADIPFGTRPDVPEWEPGRGYMSFRCEYIGATK